MTSSLSAAPRRSIGTLLRNARSHYPPFDPGLPLTLETGGSLRVTVLKPKGFWSYARHDDANAGGRIKELCRLVSYELGAQLGLGEPIDIFLDTSSIEPGEEWARMIEASLDKASFLVAIMTPGFLNRTWCCREIRRFRGREAKLGRSDLIFPIEYMEVKDWRERLKSRLPDPDVLTLLDQRQVKDFSRHRHDDPESPAVRRFVEDLCRVIARRLYPNDKTIDLKSPAESNLGAGPRVPASLVAVPLLVAPAFPEPEMVRIEPGTFFRGTTEEELRRENVPRDHHNWEQPREEVTIRHGFELGKHPVTRGEFARFIADGRHVIRKEAYIHVPGKGWELSWENDWRDPGFPQTDRHPVTCVSHHDAEAYLHWLSSQTGKCFRLPTEAEWEYACRAGTTTARFWGDDRDRALQYANVADLGLARVLEADPKPEVYFQFDDGFPFTSPVGHFAANSWGLHDMLGNVLEWTQDHWNENYSNTPKDGAAWTTKDSKANQHVLRGGSWCSYPRNVRSGARTGNLSGHRGTHTGFRLARTL